MIDSCLQLGGRLCVRELEVAACFLPDRLQITSQIRWQTSYLRLYNSGRKWRCEQLRDGTGLFVSFFLNRGASLVKLENNRILCCVTEV